jgi:hypothetical protein
MRFSSSLPQSRKEGLIIVSGWGEVEERTEEVHPYNSPSLLRPRRERPRRHAADERDDLTPVHSITSSARASTLWGISKPSALAVLRFTTNSYLVGAA